MKLTRLLLGLVATLSFLCAETASDKMLEVAPVATEETVKKDGDKECCKKDGAKECCKKDGDKECCKKDGAKECCKKDGAKECCKKDGAKECKKGEEGAKKSCCPMSGKSEKA